MSLIGGTVVTTLSGPVSDSIGRRPMLIISSLLYFICGLIMMWAPNVYVLLLARLLDGFGVGLVVILTPIYISETAPSEIRQLLNTIPQFAGSGGMFLAYCMVFAMSLKESPSWRSMLEVICGPSLIYLLLAVIFLPESPRWLISKGQMLEAKKSIKPPCGTCNIQGTGYRPAGELALLVEGLNVQSKTSVDEYVVFPVDQTTLQKDRMVVDESSHFLMIAKPLAGQSTQIMTPGGITGSLSGRVQLKGPIVSMFSSVHEPSTSQTWSRLDLVFPKTGSIASNKNSHMDLESQNGVEDSDYHYDEGGAYVEDNLETPLLSREAIGIEKDQTPGLQRSNLSMRLKSWLVLDEGGEQVSFTNIGSGWQMGWKLTEKEGEKGKEEQVKLIYLHQDTRPGSRSHVSISGTQESELGHYAAALVGGINGVLYYAPQILKQAGVAVLLTGLGIGTDSVSFLISCLITLLMLPCIALSMRLMDVSGRSDDPNPGHAPPDPSPRQHSQCKSHRITSTLCVQHVGVPELLRDGLWCDSKHTLLGDLPYTSPQALHNNLRSHILDREHSHHLQPPFLLSAIGLSGVFSIFALGCIISWVFVFLKVPETKGMPLEVIMEFFAAGTRQGSSGARNN
ncbi:hypothetical protein CRG98_022561 [Punica granatum]|nr:hypothetical protein CRG98_022561 [Punica granatum]